MSFPSPYFFFSNPFCKHYLIIHHYFHTFLNILSSSLDVLKMPYIIKKIYTSTILHPYSTFFPIPPKSLMLIYTHAKNIFASMRYFANTCICSLMQTDWRLKIIIIRPSIEGGEPYPQYLGLNNILFDSPLGLYISKNIWR